MRDKNRFPTFATILLLLGIIWFVDELGFLKINFPWIPAIVIIIATGMIINRVVYGK
jgi:hypothetical protein